MIQWDLSMSDEPNEKERALIAVPDRLVSNSENRQMELDEARNVLKKAIQFDMTLINDQTDFSRPADIDYRDLWQALSVVGNNLIETHPNLKRAGKGVGKTAPEGTVEMFVDKHSISLLLYKGEGDFLIKAGLPLSNDDPLIGYRGFLDYRKNHLVPYEKLTNTEKLKRAWIGVRWIAANILGWNGPYISPEDIISSLKLPAPNRHK